MGSGEVNWVVHLLYGVESKLMFKIIYMCF